MHALLPGDLVEILVVQDADDPAADWPSARQYFATVISSAMLFICMAPSPTSAITGRSGMRELGGDRVGHRGAHRGEPARKRAHHAAADFQIARIPVGAGARIAR